MTTVRISKADILSISPFSEQIEDLWVVCSLYKETSSNTIGGQMVTRKTHEEIS